MSHSKRNTSLAFFTAHERSLLRSHWGTQSTRLSRESFLPFGHCRLCLSLAVDPVTCPGTVTTKGGGGGGGPNTATDTTKVHLFCRECALNDLMAQRKEIKRAERDAETKKLELERDRLGEEEERKRKDLERFERQELDSGYDGTASSGDVGLKRKRLAEEMHSSSADPSNHNTPDVDDVERGGSKKSKHNPSRHNTRPSESSFWVPGSEFMSRHDKVDKDKTTTKSRPTCPSSTPEQTHEYGLKSLIKVNFSYEHDDDDRGGGTGKKADQKPICPSCKKHLTNTSRAMVGTGPNCGHVLCKSCSDLLYKPDTATAGPRCFVCEADLSGGGTDLEVGKDKAKRPQRGSVVEISCEGTGFAGSSGGTNMAKREGVSFQC